MNERKKGKRKKGRKEGSKEGRKGVNILGKECVKGTRKIFCQIL